MKIQKIDVRNFRLLKSVDLLLDDRTTVIVGRNNSGKTSLAELFRRLLSDSSPTFKLEDFHLGTHSQFWAAFTMKLEGKSETEIRDALPMIQAKITVAYDVNEPSLGPLSDFIIDLSAECTDALIDIRYQLAGGKINDLFDGIIFKVDDTEDQRKKRFFRALKDRIDKYYRATLRAVDPNDPTNEKLLDWSKVRRLLHSGFINAQRGLDDTTHKDNDVLGKVLEGLFTTAKFDTADATDRNIAQKLEEAVEVIQVELDGDFNEQLTSLIPAFALFGYPGLPDPRLRTETLLDVQRLLTNHTKIRYAGMHGVHMPEAYNGLGARNLIYILLRLLEFFKEFKASLPAPGLNLVFIEEPEAHLHPQMQEVFISQLSTMAAAFAQLYNDGKPWPVQFVVTTHSSHMANKAPFEAMRYFLATAEPHNNNICCTTIKDLAKGLRDTPEKDRAFLHQYMTLTSCDLLFADKAILIEGATERLLMPRMIERVDHNKPADQRLGSQYVSVLEVGGAYAHIFFTLLDFLELRTLIITDLDSVNADDHGKRCKVSEGTNTSNACIKHWFSDPDATPDNPITITPADLIMKPDAAKISGIRRIAYQVPEEAGRPCGRSFEDTFILANPELFSLTKDGTVSVDEAWDQAKHIKKSDFALKMALQEPEWKVPRYIREGLDWMAGELECASEPIPEISAVQVDSEVLHA